MGSSTELLIRYNLHIFFVLSSYQSFRISLWNQGQILIMSESPVSDPEKNVYGSDNKTALHGETPVYVVDEGLGESEVTEFVETKELR